MDSSQPPSGIGWVDIILVILLLLLSMFFSASETAFLSVNKLRIRYLKQKNNKKAARVHYILSNKQKFLTTGLISNTLVNSLVSVLLTSIAISMFDEGVAISIAVPVATVLVLVFGEIIPKTVALVYPEPITLQASIITTTLMKILNPFVKVFSVLTKPFLILLGMTDDQKSVNVTGEDLKTFFEISEKSGLMKPNESKMMEKILDYHNISAKTIMTPRTKIVAIHIDSSIEEILELSQNSRFSRFPVYDEDIDDIKGTFYIKDIIFSDYVLNKSGLVVSKSANHENSFNLRDHLREPIFAFEGTNAMQLERYLQENVQNMLIIIDEYGGTSGVVTLEDLTEEIFGDIEDEYDIDGVENVVTVTDDGGIIPGMMLISDVNEEFGSNFISEHHDTIAGFVLEMVGDIPEVGTTIEIDNYKLSVLEIKNNQIKKIKIIEEEAIK